MAEPHHADHPQNTYPEGQVNPKRVIETAEMQKNQKKNNKRTDAHGDRRVMLDDI